MWWAGAWWGGCARGGGPCTRGGRGRFTRCVCVARPAHICCENAAARPGPPKKTPRQDPRGRPAKEGGRGPCGGVGGGGGGAGGAESAVVAVHSHGRWVDAGTEGAASATSPLPFVSTITRRAGGKKDKDTGGNRARHRAMGALPNHDTTRTQGRRKNKRAAWPRERKIEGRSKHWGGGRTGAAGSG